MKGIAVGILVVLVLAGGLVFLRFQLPSEIDISELKDVVSQAPTHSAEDKAFRKEDIMNQSPTASIMPKSASVNSVVKYTGSPLPAPEMIIDKTKKYQAVLSTSAGNITIDLNASQVPVTVNNFVYLARAGLYDKTIFHRVINGFMIQGGDPKGDGTGGPGYRFNDEPFTGEYKRGVVAMANAGPNTNGSQFFIMHADYALPKNYVIFGSVSGGIETVDAIATAPVTMGAMGEASKPVNPVVVNSVAIVEQ